MSECVSDSLIHPFTHSRCCPTASPSLEDLMISLAALDSALSRARLGVVAALCVVGAPAAWAQGTITGRVTAAGSGEPVASARIIAVGTNSAAITGQDGKYILKHVPPGTVEVQVLHVGYQSRKQSVTVQGVATSAA